MSVIRWDIANYGVGFVGVNGVLATSPEEKKGWDRADGAGGVARRERIKSVGVVVGGGDSPKDMWLRFDCSAG